MASLVLAALFFAGIHLGVAGTALRDRAIAAVGQGGYMASFSIASAAGLAWLIFAYGRAPYVALWGMLEWWKPVAIVLMLPAILLVVIGLTTPNPTSVAQEDRLAQPPSGIVRVTRHPFLTGTALWATLHLVGNGDLASFAFFAAFAFVALAGTVSIDAKRQRLLGATRWQPFADKTSIVPFAAIAAGRNRFDLGEIGTWRWALGLVVYALVLGGHAHIIGVSPFPS
ncbi:MAG TPA: NnrU family protein [Stellaceae bacterium]|nr:NnrU family protein [Stellaceae bacterium]